MSAGKNQQEMSAQTRTVSRMWVLVAMLMLLNWAAVARAQDAVPAPAGTRTLSPTTPFQLILPQAHLLGDWYGLRPWLEDHGITPTVTFVTDALGNPTGGREQGFTGATISAWTCCLTWRSSPGCGAARSNGWSWQCVTSIRSRAIASPKRSCMKRRSPSPWKTPSATWR